MTLMRELTSRELEETPSSVLRVLDALRALVDDYEHGRRMMGMNIVEEENAKLRAEVERLRKPLEHADYFVPQLVQRDKEIADLTAQLAQANEQVARLEGE